MIGNLIRDTRLSTKEKPSPIVTPAPSKRERFLRATRKESVDRTPVWLMRQAGRYLPQYREIKKDLRFQDLCARPDIAAEISMQPYEILGVDAIIVFNDILIPFEHIGLSVSFNDSGPEIEPAVRTDSVLNSLHKPDFGETPPVYETIGHIRKSVGKKAPILGFVGGPFTMAAYAIEGRMSKNFVWIKTLRYSHPDLLKRLLESITQTVTEYLCIQISAGADAVQVFDTWAGILTTTDYREFVLPYQQQVIRAAHERGVPAILYVNSCTPYIFELGESGADVLSIDWRTDLKCVYEHLDGRCALQGNLDPTTLSAPPEKVSAYTRNMLEGFGQSRGYIANLGHGVLPTTPVESVQAFVETVQGYVHGNSE